MAPKPRDDVTEALLGEGGSTSAVPEAAPAGPNGSTELATGDSDAKEQKMSLPDMARCEAQLHDVHEHVRALVKHAPPGAGQVTVDLSVVNSQRCLANSSTAAALGRSHNITEARRRSHSLHRWLLSSQVIFSVLCLIALAVVYKHEDNYTGPPTLLGIPVVFCCALAAIAFPVYFACGLLARAMLRLAEKLPVGAGSVHYAIIGIDRPLCLFLTACTLCLATIALSKEFDEGSHHSMMIIFKASLVLLIFSAVTLFAQLLCRILSMRVHATSLLARLKDAIEKESVLARLMAPPCLDDTTPGCPGCRAVAELRGLLEREVSPYLHTLHKASLTTTCTCVATVADQMQHLTKIFADMTVDQLDEHAAHAAEYLWCTCRENVKSDRLTLRDFRRTLQDSEAARFAFGLFDIDGDNFVVEAEVLSRCKGMYRERRNIAQTLADTEEIISTLERLVGGILHVLAFFAYLALFGVDVGHLVISVSSMALAFTFVFGNSIRNIYESVVFLFVVNPFEVGDVLLFKGEHCHVEGFGLLTTQLQHITGRLIWVPNNTLMASEIINLSQSANTVVFQFFEVDAEKLNQDALSDLSGRLKAAVAEHPHFFDAAYHPWAHMHAFSDPLKYKIEVTYGMAFNAADYERECSAKYIMNGLIGKWVNDYGVTNSAPLQQGFLAAPRSSEGRRR